MEKGESQPDACKITTEAPMYLSWARYCFISVVILSHRDVAIGLQVGFQSTHSVGGFFLRVCVRRLFKGVVFVFGNPKFGVFEVCVAFQFTSVITAPESIISIIVFAVFAAAVTAVAAGVWVTVTITVVVAVVTVS